MKEAMRTRVLREEVTYKDISGACILLYRPGRLELRVHTLW
jgi:hypothetical protein